MENLKMKLSEIKETEKQTQLISKRLHCILKKLLNKTINNDEKEILLGLALELSQNIEISVSEFIRLSNEY